MSERKKTPAIAENHEEKKSHGWDLLKKKPGITVIETVSIQS